MNYSKIKVMSYLTKFVKAPKNKKHLPYFKRKYYNGIVALMLVYNRIIDLLRGKELVSSGSKDLDEVRRRSLRKTDINDHLETLFLESLSVRPKLIVELGVGLGESTFVLEKVAEILGSKFISVDINPLTSKASNWPGWTYVNSDDIEFAKNFPDWCRERGIEPEINILFIDTSHRYEHTVSEIKYWFPFLSVRSKVFFHDTNTHPIYWRKDGSVGITYQHEEKAVMRAIESYLGASFNERKDFSDFRNGWAVKHHHFCNGFTILEKIR